MSAVKNRALALSLLAAGAVGGMSGTAWATPSPPTPITIVNPSFEADTTSSGSSGSQDYWFVGSFTGWTDTAGVAGWYHPSTVEFPGGGNVSTAATNIPDGHQVAFLAGASSLSQTLAATAQGDALYTLTFSVGRRADLSLGNYSVKFLIGGNVVSTLSNPVFPAAGTFSQATLSFLLMPTSPLVGQQLGIALISSGSSSQQAIFDNLSLTQQTGVPVPEPKGIFLVGITALALLVSVRMQRTGNTSGLQR